VRHKLTVLAVWWAAIILLDVRAFPTFTTVPVAMLAGMAVSDVVIPMLDRARTDLGLVSSPGVASGHGMTNGHGAAHANGSDVLLADGNESTSSSIAARLHLPAGFLVPNWQTLTILLFLLTYAAVGAMIRKPGLGGEGEYLTPLSGGERTAMHWIAEETPASSTFLVMPRGPWQVDKESEWFPVLAARPSIATVQGTEWSPNGGFDAAIAAFDGAWDCGYQSSDCLATWAQTNGKKFTHVYIPDNGKSQCCGTLIDSLSEDPDYLKIYDGPGGTVFALVGTLPAKSDTSPSS
jgi:hypothetical protein